MNRGFRATGATFATLALSIAPLTGIQTPAAASMNHYVGPLHTHTGYSDGTKGTTPATAYAYARDVEGLDFLAVTEHSEALDVPVTLSETCLPPGGGLVECAIADPATPANSIEKWEAQRRYAVAASRADDFLALRGFEWTSDVYGHVNVYFSRNYTGRARDAGDTTVEGFYQWLRTPAAAGGGADALAVFNHPNDKKLSDADPRKNWNDFAYVPDLDERVVGIEIYNRAKNYESWVVRALDKGWHLGVIGAEDIHETNWGSNAYAKTVFVAPRLTPGDFKDAMRARRTYAVLDRSLRIDFTAGGEPMGSRIRTQAPTVPLSVSVSGSPVANVDLVSNTGTVVATAAGGALAYDAPVTGAERYYFVRVRNAAGARIGYSSPIWIAAGSPEPFAPRWVAGDLHIHTTFSHDVCDTPPTPEHCDADGDGKATDFFTWGYHPGDQVALGETRGLDFMVITDHNDTRGVYDPGFSSDRLTLVPGYENSLAGHAQMVNAISCFFPEGRVSSTRNCSSFPNKSDRARMRALGDALRAAGGLFQINHPSDNGWLNTFGDGSHPDPVVPDSVEVWNIGAWLWQQPAFSSNDNDFSLRFWESYLNRGFHVAATGGSDSHWRSTSPVQGIGQPTTWVWVTKPGIAGIVEGIRAGRTTLSHQPPAYAGPRLFLEADADGDATFEGMIGDTVPATSTLRLRAEGIAPGSIYRIAWGNASGASWTEIPAQAIHTLAVPSGAKWVRAELRHPDAQTERTASCNSAFGGQTTWCRNRLVVEALTSAIFVA